MAKKKIKKKKPKKSKKVTSKKKARKPVVPRKTIVNIPDTPIDPAKIERERERKKKERQMMKEMGITKPKTAKTTNITKTIKLHPVIRDEIVIRFKKDLGAKTPDYAYSDDAGLDLYSNEDKVLAPMHRAPVKTGIYFELPKGYVGLVWDKGGPPLKQGLHAMAGVLDSGYRGELKIILINLSSKTIKIEKGTKIAQLVIQKVERARLEESQSLDDSERGDGGFGSSGLKENPKKEDDNDYKESVILEIDTTKKKPKHTVKIGQEKLGLKNDIKNAIKDDSEDHLF